MKPLSFLLLNILITGSVTAQKLNSLHTDSVTLRFNNPAVGFNAELEGLLQWPVTNEKHPLLVFVHGAGTTNRYEYSNMFSHFLQKGFAVFSYDKRGVNKSGGSYYGIGPRNSPMMIPLLASDVSEAINEIIKRPDIDTTTVVLIGASQAEWIIPVAANINKAVTHFIILYGPTVSVGEEIYYSKFAEFGNLSPAQAEDSLKNFTGIRGFDPMPFIKTLTAKGLWLFGGDDHSLPTNKSIKNLKLLSYQQKKLFTIKYYPDAGHGLINYRTGKKEAFGKDIADWLRINMRHPLPKANFK